MIVSHVLFKLWMQQICAIVLRQFIFAILCNAAVCNVLPVIKWWWNACKILQ